MIPVELVVYRIESFNLRSIVRLRVTANEAYRGTSELQHRHALRSALLFLRACACSVAPNSAKNSMTSATTIPSDETVNPSVMVSVNVRSAAGHSTLAIVASTSSVAHLCRFFSGIYRTIHYSLESETISPIYLF
jgi:uncharacterized lipoprotein YajG